MVRESRIGCQVRRHERQQCAHWHTLTSVGSSEGNSPSPQCDRHVIGFIASEKAKKLTNNCRMDFAVDELQRHEIWFNCYREIWGCGAPFDRLIRFHLICVRDWRVHGRLQYAIQWSWEKRMRHRDENKIVEIYDLPCKSRTTKIRQLVGQFYHSAYNNYRTRTDKDRNNRSICADIHSPRFQFIRDVYFLPFQQFSFFVSARSMQQIQTVKRTHNGRSIFQLYISFVVCFFSHGISHLTRQCVKRRNSNGTAALICATHELSRVHETNMPHTDAALALTCIEVARSRYATRVKRRWWICHQLSQRNVSTASVVWSQRLIDIATTESRTDSCRDAGQEANPRRTKKRNRVSHE